MKLSKKLLGSVAALAVIAGGYAAQAASHSKELVVAYFPEWPMPFQVGQANPKLFEDAGLNIKWVSFRRWYGNVSRHGIRRRPDCRFARRDPIPDSRFCRSGPCGY